MEKKMIPKPEI